MADDAQTHRLPPDRAGIARLAIFLGYPRPRGLRRRTRAPGSASVEKHYAELFEEAPSLAGPGNLVFTGTEDDPETLATLARLGFAEPAQVAAMVRGWHHGRIRATRSQRAREILTEFVPELLRVFGGTANPDTALLRFDQFLSRLPAGVQLFSLFHANPGLFSLVADIMAEAPLLAESLAQRPALLDAVLTAEFSVPPARSRRARRRSRRAARAARAVSRTRSTCCGAGPTSGGSRSGCSCCAARSTATRPGAALADIADAGIAALLPAVAADFARVHGEVPGGAFAIVAMGRLGSREMTLASDLDLILIYDAPGGQPAGSTGPRPLAVSTYYARLSQRLISAMTAPTAEGRLYEVDMRLRPSGESRADRVEPRRLRAVSARSGLDLGAHGADPGAADRRRPGAVRARRRRDPDGADPDARPGPAACSMSPICGAASPRPIRRRRRGICATGRAASSISNSRCNTCCCARRAAQPELLHGDPAAAIAALGAAGVLPPQAARELGEALRLLRHLRALLALLFDGVPDAARCWPAPAGADPGALRRRD